MTSRSTPTTAVQLSKVGELVDDALARGARVLTGGKPSGGPGFFYQPTVLVDVPESARLRSEEIFGPVAAICEFTTEAKAPAMTDDTEYLETRYIATQVD